MSNCLRPFEAEIFKLLENRRERLCIHPTTLYMQALGKTETAAYRHHKRLRDTHSGLPVSPANTSTLTLEDASRLARYMQIDLSDIVRQAEQNMGYPSRQFPRIKENNPHKKKPRKQSPTVPV